MSSAKHSWCKLPGGTPGIAVVVALLAVTAASADPLWEPDAVEASDRKAVLVVSPSYPEKAWRQRRQGRVIVCFDIQANGRTKKAYVLASSNRVFNKSALKAVRLSRFEELDAGTEPEDSCRTFQFLLEPEKAAATTTP